MSELKELFPCPTASTAALSVDQKQEQWVQADENWSGSAHPSLLPGPTLCTTARAEPAHSANEESVHQHWQPATYFQPISLCNTPPPPPKKKKLSLISIWVVFSLRYNSTWLVVSRELMYTKSY